MPWPSQVEQLRGSPSAFAHLPDPWHSGQRRLSVLLQRRHHKDMDAILTARYSRPDNRRFSSAVRDAAAWLSYGGGGVLAAARLTWSGRSSRGSGRGWIGSAAVAAAASRSPAP
jgi:hypothetical protein